VLKARYLHRAYYTYLIHEITLESVQLYGHNIIFSGVLGARWLPPRRGAVSGRGCKYRRVRIYPPVQKVQLKENGLEI